MLISILTQKGQTTIPKEIRDHLHLQSKDKIIYVRDGQRVYLQTVRGNILDTAGVFKKPFRHPINFKTLREKTKKQVAEAIARKGQ